MAVGPTGVGKTTTLAKIAGHFQLRERLRVGFITVDTYRVGAIEQLQSYAQILQAPLRTATNPNELRSAIDELDDVDLILIDSAGRSPWDDSKLEELRNLTQVTVADHVLLVLSLTTDAAMLCKIADRFSSASPTSLILTKLDEIPRYGRLLSVARNVPHPVSYITTGQDVPDQIEPAHPTRLARLILSQDQIQQPLENSPESI
jgi:flagellar biosynthesis protein FlhF